MSITDSSCRNAYMLTCFAAIFVASENTLQAQKPMAWKLAKNRVMDVVLDQDTQMKLDGLPGTTQPNESRTIQRMEMAWKVLDQSADGVSTVEQSISRVVFEMKSANDNFTIDTNDNKPLSGRAEFMAKELRPFAGAKFLVKTKPTGETVDVTFPAAATVNSGLADSGLAETGMREIAANSALKLPTTPVQVGETWQNQYELDMRLFGKLIVSTTYQYLGEETVNGMKLDKIKATTANRSADPTAKSGLKLTKQESSGIIWFDTERGCIDHSEFQQQMELDVVQSGQQIKQDVKQNYKIKFTPRP